MQLRRRQRGNGETKQEEINDFVCQAPLASLPEGEKAKITHVTGETNVVRRLSEMGFTPGTELTLLRKCSFRGPIEIEVRGAAIAIGYALASEICVQPLKDS